MLRTEREDWSNIAACGQKMAPKRLHGTKMAQRRFKKGPKMAPRGPKKGDKRVKLPQGEPKMTQDGAEIGEDAPRVAPRGPKRAPG